MNKKEIIEEAGRCPNCGKDETMGFVKEKETLLLVCKYCHAFEEISEDKLDEDEEII